MNVSDIGEQGLLARLYPFCSRELVGDDAAVLAIEPGHQLVVTTDVLVDGVHFSMGHASPGVHTTSPVDVGWRSTAANLSDLAAMGATPLAITIGLSLPGKMPVAQVEELYQGIAECLRPFNVVIAGGDVCQSPTTSVAITALGQIRPNRVLRRSAARPGDAIVVTGIHGASRAGLELLLHPEAGAELSAAERKPLIQVHQRPRPRLDVVAVLEQVGAFEGDRLPAAMDSSDGLADAVLQISRNSAVGAQLDYRQIPMPSCFERWLPPEQAIDWALYGGEDFELVLCLPMAIAHKLVAQLGGETAIVGTIVRSPGVILTDSQNEYSTQALSLSEGFQHFSQGQ